MFILPSKSCMLLHASLQMAARSLAAWFSVGAWSLPAVAVVVRRLCGHQPVAYAAHATVGTVNNAAANEASTTAPAAAATATVSSARPAARCRLGDVVDSASWSSCADDIVQLNPWATCSKETQARRTRLADALPRWAGHGGRCHDILCRGPLLSGHKLPRSREQQPVRQVLE